MTEVKSVTAHLLLELLLYEVSHLTKLSLLVFVCHFHFQAVKPLKHANRSKQICLEIILSMSVCTVQRFNTHLRTLIN